MQSIRSLLPYLRPYRWYMLVVILSAAGITAMNLVNPWLVRELIQLIRTDQPATAMERVIQLAVVLVVVFIVRSVCRYLYAYLAHIMAYRFVNDLRIALYAHLQHLSARFFSENQTGELLKRVIVDTRDIEPLFAHYIPDMTVNILLLIGVGGILISLHPVLALLTLLPVPLLLIGTQSLSKRMRTSMREASNRLGTLSGMVQDNLTGIKEIQLFTQEQREHVRIHDASEEATGKLLYGLKMDALFRSTVELLTAMGIVIVVLFGGQAALNGQMQVEDLVAFVLYLSIFYQPITVMAQMHEILHVALTAADHVTTVLDMQPDVAEAPDCIDPQRLRGEVVFKDVGFEYNQRVPTLHNVSFKVSPGQMLALAGPTGAGKTTIASLLPRFYDVSSGTITIDGIDVRTMSISGLRRNISMVLQDVFLFNGTILENIRYGDLTASDEDIIRASKAARAHEFITALPDGYNTHIGERGVKLSGGQKQRLAIARAVLKDAPILILDEATSAVDTETEAEIQAALNELMQGRTSIVIAHRLSTIRHADQILVLEAGRIVERGRHQELIFSNGRYQHLHEAHVRLN
ncbi:MAG: ABC transporter ATP-binding protein [Anaerolineae bacterium]|nr:ABC transporter ATP-binding protein [Anaerolineae bacterium]